MLNLFSTRPDHPLGDAKELKRVLVELPLDNSFRAVDEVYGWFESLQVADDFRVDHLFDVVRQLDDAAQPFIRRLSRDYLLAPRLSRSEERRLWSMCFNYWGEVSLLYARCVERARANPKDKGSEIFKAALPLASARLIGARRRQLKWEEFRYGPVGEDFWRGLGQPYLAAEAAGVATKPVQLYPGSVGMRTVTMQYLQALVFCASSMDSLMPLEIELADRLIAHLLSGFVLSAECRPDSVCWIDAAAGTPPLRLAKQPTELTASLRFFAPGTAPQGLNDLIRAVERGNIPGDIDLGGEFQPKVLLPVLRHLATHWSAEPPQREHQRHAVKTRIAVLKGFDDCFTIFAGDVARVGKEHSAESWVVENVSLGGFGAAVDTLAGDDIRLGALLAIQPEGGDNWVLGVVRRFNRDSENHASVGIKALSKTARSVQLWPRTGSFTAAGAIPGIWLGDEHTDGELRFVLPAAAFDLKESLELIDRGGRMALMPLDLEEAGVGFEIARFRVSSQE